MMDANCKICTTEFHSEITGADHESIEQAVFNGWSYRDVAKKIMEFDGGSLHALEQVIRKHCILHVDWKDYGCPICSVSGENLVNRFAVEKVLRENKDRRKVLELREYFALFTNVPYIDPTSSEMVKRVEFHRGVCMRRYEVKSTERSDQKKNENNEKETVARNDDFHRTNEPTMRLTQAVL